MKTNTLQKTTAPESDYELVEWGSARHHEFWGITKDREAQLRQTPPLMSPETKAVLKKMLMENDGCSAEEADEIIETNQHTR